MNVKTKKTIKIELGMSITEKMGVGTVIEVLRDIDDLIKDETHGQCCLIDFLEEIYGNNIIESLIDLENDETHFTEFLGNFIQCHN